MSKKTSNRALSQGVEHGAENPRYAVCIHNQGNEASLEIGKFYQVLPDPEAARHGLMRVVDESGEDYGFPAAWFVMMEVPGVVERALREAYSYGN